MGRHGMRWKELRWDELRWSAIVKCGVWGVKSAMWSVRKVFALYPGRAQVMFLDSNTATALHKARTHGPGWRTAHASSLVVVLGRDSWKLRWHMKRDELGWGEKSSDEMKCGVWRVQCEVWGVKGAVWSVECEVWSVKKAVRSWSVDCEVWSVECEVRSLKSAVWSEVWTVKCEVWSVKSGVLRVQCEVWSVECEAWSVECEECSEKCEVRSGASNVTRETGHHFRRMHARTGLAGARRMQVL